MAVPVLHTIICVSAVCGGTYTSSSTSQVITSPGYPNAFRQNVQCRWTIDAPSTNDQVEIQVTVLNLQTTTDCGPEYLEIRDYPLVGVVIFPYSVILLHNAL